MSETNRIEKRIAAGSSGFQSAPLSPAAKTSALACYEL